VEANERAHKAERRPPSAPSGRPALLLSELYAPFTSMYLTLTSIIQGVALAYLVVVVDDESHSFGVANWILVTTVFLVIAAAWHEYMTAVTVFAWIPHLRDSLIPFLLGGAELILIRSLKAEAELEWFFLAMTLTVLMTFVAFLNMYVSAAAEPERNGWLLVETRFYKSLTFIFVGSAAICFLLFSLVESRVASSSLDLGLAVASLAFVVAFLVRSSLYWHRVVELARRDAIRTGHPKPHDGS